jgi:multidrug transporter EmrE-like cation transporter
VTKGFHFVILLSVAITAAAQLVLKVGMTNAPVQRLIGQGFSPRLIAIFFDPYVFGGLVLYVGAAMLWLFVLAKFEVSYAYPFVALGFVITALAGWLFFDDAMSLGRALGTLLICAGVVLVARS